MTTNLEYSTMDNKAGNIGDVPKHFILAEGLKIKADMFKEICFYDAFGGNYITYGCREEAQQFYKNATAHAKMSPYYNHLKEAEVEGNIKNYPGSTKLARDIFAASGDQCKVIYNSFAIVDVVKCLAESQQDFKRVPIEFRSANAYHLIDEYKHEIEKCESGIILLDPFYKNREKDISGCKKIIDNLNESLNKKAGWSIMLWIPYNSEECYNLAKQLKVEYLSKGFESSLLSILDPKFEGESQTIKGIGLLLINIESELVENIMECDIQKLGMMMDRPELQFLID